MPTDAIDPNSSTIMPPITTVGMELKKAPIFPTKDIKIAQIAAQVITLVLKLRVNVTAPITSA